MNSGSTMLGMMIIGIIALLGLPMAFASDALILGNVAAAIPVVLIIEFLVYLVVTLLLNPRLGLVQGVVLAAGLVVLRAICSLVGGGLAVALHGAEGTPDPLAAWGANPLVAVLQVIVLLMMAPLLLGLLVSQPPAAQASEAPNQSKAPTKDNRASGPIQVFSYEELSGTLRKVPGLEGFLVVSSEGLVVWRDLPLRLEVDALAARLFSSERLLGGLMEGNNLSRQKRVILQTREHTLCVQELDANFGLILVYGGRVSLSEIDERLEVLAQTVRVFVQWKYPGLIVISPTTISAVG